MFPSGRKDQHVPQGISGNKHYLYAEVAREDEITAYRNLALNPADQHMDVPCYPHATANVETRGESVFAAKTPSTVSGRTAPTENGPTNPGASICRMTQP